VTDGQTDRIVMAKTRPAVARKNGALLFSVRDYGRFTARS